MPFVCSFVQHDGAQDRGSVGQHGYPDLQRPNLGVAHRRLSGTAGGKAGYCGSRIEQQRVAPQDDTGTRVNGVNQHCQVICNPLYGAYFTTARKDRLTIIDVLRNGRERVFRFNEEALGLLRQFGVSQRVLEQVGQLPFHQDWSQERSEERLAEQIPDLVPGVQKRIVEAAALAAYHAESGHVRLLVCDDARQFKLVADELALCWVHDGRHYQSLTPCVPQHREWLEAFRQRYWEFYKQLRAYQEAPRPERPAQDRKSVV